MKPPDRIFDFAGQSPDDIQESIKRWAFVKGWNDKERSFDEWTALFHTEISEAYEEYRKGQPVTAVYFTEDEQGYAKPEGIPIELADEVIRIMHWFANHKMSLTSMLTMKMNYNACRPYRHGNKVT